MSSEHCTKAVAIHINVEICFDNGDDETKEFADRIQSALTAAHCVVSMNAESFGGSHGGQYVGIQISGIHDDQKAAKVRKAFEETEIEFTSGPISGAPNPDSQNGQVTINVFVKPRPNFK
jgi:hypothetical protein